MARELVDLRPDAILVQTTPVTDALVRETRTIPIVFVTVSDPMASGFVTSLARPGGNVTGFALFEPSMGGKWVELLKEIAPRTVRVALLFNPATGAHAQFYMPSFKPPHHPLPSRRVPLRFMRRMRSKALSPHKRAIRVAASSWCRTHSPRQIVN